MRNIFISYAREDRAKIQQLAEALTQAGWSVWWDREIPLGRSYATVISDALESAHCVIVAWSRHAIASRWVQDEANHALSRGVLVPVMLETVAPPLGFGTLQAADLVGWNGDLAASEFVRLSDAVRGMIQHPNPTVPNVPPVVSPWAGPAPAPAAPPPPQAPPRRDGKMRYYRGMIPIDIWESLHPKLQSYISLSMSGIRNCKIVTITTLLGILAALCVIPAVKPPDPMDSQEASGILGLIAIFDAVLFILLFLGCVFKRRMEFLLNAEDNAIIARIGSDFIRKRLASPPIVLFGLPIERNMAVFCLVLLFCSLAAVGGIMQELHLE